MRRAVIRVVVVSVVATCFACPIFQAFDHWDHGEKSGKDTETTLIMVALSVGLAIPATGLVFKTCAMAGREIHVADFSLDGNRPAFAKPPVPVSQPPPILRI
jgi:hypothetical protein